MGKKATGYFIIGTFVTLYLLVSVISTIHVIDFFMLSNPKWLAISLAIAFEVGAAASLASLITLEKMNKGIVWSLFIILTLMQAMGNTFYAFTHLQNFQGWIELFGLVDEELIYQKRVLSIVSGAILPVVALGFIKSLVDYIKPADTIQTAVNDQITDAVTQAINPDQVLSDDGLAEEFSSMEELFNQQAEISQAVGESIAEYEKSDPEVLGELVDTDQVEETTTTTQKPRIDRTRSLDELIARGMPISGATSLKKPFDP